MTERVEAFPGIRYDSDPGEGGAPSGAAGGDLGGTYPNPTVDGIANLPTADEKAGLGNGSLSGANLVATIADVPMLSAIGENLVPADDDTYHFGSPTFRWGNAYFAGNLVLTGLPTTDPAVVGQVWNNLGALMISAG